MIWTNLLVFLVTLSVPSLYASRIYPSQIYPNAEFFQGDILLRNGTIPDDRFATQLKEMRWPGGIVYYILDDYYSEHERELIRSAMDEFEKETCIKWIERTDEDYYVEIISDIGCFAELGQVGGVQYISLETPKCMNKGKIMHEMMHALGFVHEQDRADRDFHVSVVWSNIEEGSKKNFRKMPPMELDTFEYDHRSITHYRYKIYAKDPSEPTLVALNGVPLHVLGEGITIGYFTETDKKKISKFYEC